MWLKWFPWRLAVQHVTKKRGFLDPFNLLEQLQKFAQPSEIAMPIEIIRLGSSLHARGLLNSQAVQHNLDWIWPFWVERQFDPHDIAFIPRAFSISHINLTHRNWTAVGMPDCALFPIVDPAGLTTPFFDSWSIDAWIMTDSRDALIPSRLPAVDQKLLIDDRVAILTQATQEPFYLSTLVELVGDPSFPVCQMRIAGRSNEKAWCIISLRPYNPEGVSFVHKIDLLKDHQGWKVNGKHPVFFNEAPERCAFSDYRNGDVHHFLPDDRHCEKIICDVGMATAAVAYGLEPGKAREVVIRIPLIETDEEGLRTNKFFSLQDAWNKNLEGACKLTIPDKKFEFLYDAALKTMVLHSPKEVYPGPYTYKHFWFRDAAFILNGMLCAGLSERAEKVIDASFFSRQNVLGYFHSQDGEWDSNGQALWTLAQFCKFTGKKPKPEWKKAIEKGAKWIQRKRLPENPRSPHAGLFPPGFSAEHLGPNDYYYWDDFWGAAGLAAASELQKLYNDPERAARLEASSNDFMESIENSLSMISKRLGFLAMPASPYRRMDSGAIGSIAAGYPLQLWDAKDMRLLATTEYLMQNCFVGGGFFHDMSHSGVNPYLTLHIAQNLLRAGDPRHYELMKAIADLASPTGQWPEAVHPKTKGGCMGDGQHVWAAAEWVLMIRNCFIREERERLILFSGIPESWLENRETIHFGPAPTHFGIVDLLIKFEADKTKLIWTGKWFGAEPSIEIALSGHGKIVPQKGQTQVELTSVVRS